MPAVKPPDKPRAVCTRRPIMRMSWHDLLFAHWPVDAAALQPHVPPTLTIETFDSAAWLGVVPFRMSNVGLIGLPNVPGASAFPELNVRTYVTDGERSGVWFFSLDAASPLSVRLARLWFGLNYQHATMSCTTRADGIDYCSSRRIAPDVHAVDDPPRFTARYRPVGQPFTASPGTLEHWLTERYALYALRRGRLIRGEIQHDPWPLRSAEAFIEHNTMTAPLGVTLTGDPHLLFAERLDVAAWGPRTIGGA